MIGHALRPEFDSRNRKSLNLLMLATLKLIDALVGWVLSYDSVNLEEATTIPTI